MLRAVITGTIATADTEQEVPHGLGTTPDFAFITRRTTAAGALPSTEMGSLGNARGVEAISVDVYAESAATNFSLTCGVWQGRSY